MNPKIKPVTKAEVRTYLRQLANKSESLDAYFAAQMTPAEKHYCELAGISFVDFVRAKIAN